MRTWRKATEIALYGTSGFFTRHAPADHFRTSATASPLFAAALATLVAQIDAILGRPDRLELADVGAGRGELLLSLAEALPDERRARARFVAVERAARPAHLPEWIDWRTEAPRRMTGVVLASEWLDNVPLDVVEVDEAGAPRLVLVDESGVERLAGPPSTRDMAWLNRWWWPHHEPATQARPESLSAPEPGTRAEVGWPRDDAWASAVAALHRGVALAVDYGHLAHARPTAGTLTGYRDGRQVAPVPDGSCDVTAHVAMDAVAAAGEAVTGSPSHLTDQRTALGTLGVSSSRPPRALASTDPSAYVRGLAAASQAAELTDLFGLGAHCWLLQPVGLPASCDGGAATLLPR